MSGSRETILAVRLKAVEVAKLRALAEKLERTFGIRSSAKLVAAGLLRKAIADLDAPPAPSSGSAGGTP